jgi:UDP-GlcNAc3NAcA epimerase
MIKILTVIGARPQIIKAAALSRTIKGQFAGAIEEIIVHTGQHYDDNMSKVFLEELNVPDPSYNLRVGSASHGRQTALMIEKLEEVINNEQPDFVVLFGDTNSTLAGSVAASKLHFPVIHIEAGLRSFNKRMPEEINRILCDHTSTLLFSPTKTAIDNLIREGFNPEHQPPFSIDCPGIFHSGDIMLDNTLFFADIAEKKSTILKRLNLQKGLYSLGTIHRDNNTDQPERLNAIFEALFKIASEYKTDIVLPLHPRTSKILHKSLKSDLLEKLSNNSFIKIIQPVSFFDTHVLEKYCQLILTDSGGVQKEAYFHNKPVLVLRSETEWIEIIENGTGLLTDADPNKILNGYRYFQHESDLQFPPIFGDGKASAFICKKILNASS